MKLAEIQSKLHPGIENLIFIYPGRFQPFGMHHYAAYEIMREQYGENVVFSMSNIMKIPDSPFNFDEKVEIMKHYGINPNIIFRSKIPYAPEYLMESVNPNTTAFVFFLSEKDWGRIQPQKKDGTDAYITDIRDDTTIENILHHSYIIKFPYIKMYIDGEEYCSSLLRKKLIKNDYDTYVKYLGWYDKDLANLISVRLQTIKLTESILPHSSPLSIYLK